MANGNALFIKNGLMSQLQASDQLRADVYDSIGTTLAVGGVNATTVNLATGNSIAAVSLGTGTTDKTISIGAAGDTIEIGPAGLATSTINLNGNVTIRGTENVVGTSTFDTDANFNGNVTFGDGAPPTPGSDTVSFHSRTWVTSDITFGPSVGGGRGIVVATPNADGIGGRLNVIAGSASGAGFTGGYLIEQAGQGGAASATVDGGTGGETDIRGGTGGIGSATNAPGAGGFLLLSGGNAGVQGAGTGDANGGNIHIVGGKQTNDGIRGRVFFGDVSGEVDGTDTIQALYALTSAYGNTNQAGLRYNATQGKWEYRNHAGSWADMIGSGGVLPTGTVTWQHLRWNGSAWVAEGGTSTTDGLMLPNGQTQQTITIADSATARTLLVRGNAASGANVSGGNLELAGGTATGTGDGGAVNVYGGNASSDGGPVNVYGGNSSGGNAGGANLTGGNATGGTGNGGSVHIAGGTSIGGTAGTTYLYRNVTFGYGGNTASINLMGETGNRIVSDVIFDQTSTREIKPADASSGAGGILRIRGGATTDAAAGGGMYMYGGAALSSGTAGGIAWIQGGAADAATGAGGSVDLHGGSGLTSGDVNVGFYTGAASGWGTNRVRIGLAATRPMIQVNVGTGVTSLSESVTFGRTAAEHAATGAIVDFNPNEVDNRAYNVAGGTRVLRTIPMRGDPDNACGITVEDANGQNGTSLNFFSGNADSAADGQPGGEAQLLAGNGSDGTAALSAGPGGSVWIGAGQAGNASGAAVAGGDGGTVSLSASSGTPGNAGGDNNGGNGGYISLIPGVAGAGAGAGTAGTDGYVVLGNAGQGNAILLFKSFDYGAPTVSAGPGFRYNSTTNRMEYSNGTTWSAFYSGATIASGAVNYQHLEWNASTSQWDANTILTLPKNPGSVAIVQVESPSGADLSTGLRLLIPIALNNADGGALQMESGVGGFAVAAGDTPGAAGAVQIAGASGGWVTHADNTTASGEGGAIQLIAGPGGRQQSTSVNTAGNGGLISITGGTGGQSQNNGTGGWGGGITITGGNGGQGTVSYGNGGQVTITGGASSDATGGNVVLNGGSGATRGSVILGYSKTLSVILGAYDTWTFTCSTSMLAPTGSANISLPNNGSARFQIEGTSVTSTAITAANMDKLFNGSTLTATDNLHYHDTSGGSSFPIVAAEALAVGSVVGIAHNSTVAARVGFLVDASTDLASDTTPFVAGITIIAAAAAGDTATVAQSGEVDIPDALWDAAPAANTDRGKIVWASATNPGNVTLTAPTTGYKTKVGFLKSYAAGGPHRVTIQIGDPVAT